MKINNFLNSFNFVIKNNNALSFKSKINLNIICIFSILIKIINCSQTDYFGTFSVDYKNVKKF